MADDDNVAAVRIEGVRKVYGAGDSAFVALEDLSLDIRDNEFFYPAGSLWLRQNHLTALHRRFRSDQCRMHSATR